MVVNHGPPQSQQVLFAGMVDTLAGQDLNFDAFEVHGREEWEGYKEPACEGKHLIYIIIISKYVYSKGAHWEAMLLCLYKLGNTYFIIRYSDLYSTKILHK